MPYEIKIENLNELRAAFQKAPEIADKELQKATKDAGKLILATEKTEAPVKTGQLRRSITLEYRPISATITPTVNYALPVHEGSKPHIITPRRKSVLAFKKNGKLIFARKVNHPGNKPNKFVERTVNKSENPVNALFLKALDNIIKFLTA
jgi:HK97 gp10 family phage protein